MVVIKNTERGMVEFVKKWYILHSEVKGTWKFTNSIATVAGIVIMQVKRSMQARFWIKNMWCLSLCIFAIPQSTTPLPMPPMTEKIDNIVTTIWFSDGMCVAELPVMTDLSGKRSQVIRMWLVICWTKMLASRRVRLSQ